MGTELSAAEIAGIADLFEGLTRDELKTAIQELSYRQDTEYTDIEGHIDSAIAKLVLVPVEMDDGTCFLAPGPAAFPQIPEGGEDIPHILDIEPRDIPREKIGTAAEEHIRQQAAHAIATEDSERAAEILDRSYDITAFAPVDIDDIQTALLNISDKP